MRKWFTHLKNQKGLTLIELLAVVVILGIIAAIAVPAVGNIIDNSKDDAHKANALLIINSAKLGIVSGDITPTIVSGGITLNELVDAGVLDAVPSNPSIDGQSYDGEKSFVTHTKTTQTSTYAITLTIAGSSTKHYYNNVLESALNAGTKPDKP